MTRRVHTLFALCLLAGTLLGGREGMAASPFEDLANAAASSGRAQQALADGRTGPAVQDLQAQTALAIRRAADALAPDGGASTTKPGEPGEGELSRQGTRTAEPDMPSEESVLPAGDWAIGRLGRDGGVDVWQPELPATDLKKLTDAFRSGRLPSRYRRLLQDYGRSLASGEDGDAAGQP
jgi:hypothetical protein